MRAVNVNCLLQVMNDIPPEAKTLLTGMIDWIFHLLIWLPGSVEAHFAAVK